MGTQTYGSIAPRLGKLAGRIIGHAMHTEVLSTVCTNEDMPQNKSDTIVFRSWVPFGATIAQPNRWDGTNGTTQVSPGAHVLNEGVTPTADTITARDVTMQLKQYGALYQLTDKDYNLYEDDIADAMVKQVGERMGLVRELTLYEGMKAATSVFYAAGVAGISSITSAITSGTLNSVVRFTKANHGKLVRDILAPSVNIGTTSVESAFVCFVHTDAEYDLRALPNFTVVADYGTRKTICPEEFGSWQNIRFVTSPELNPIIGATGVTSAVAGAPTLLSSGGSFVDIYPFIFVAQDAFAQVKVRGLNDVEPTFIKPGQKDKSDPLGQRGFIGAKFWNATAPLNPSWISVIYAGVSKLS